MSKHTRIGAPIALLVFGLGALGCDRNNGNPSEVFDTTGEAFRWTCHASGCDASSESKLLVTCGGEPNDDYMYFRRRFVTVCAAYPDGSFVWTAPSTCRLLACEATSDCPQFEGGRYECEQGLCQQSGHDGTLYEDDLLALCLAHTPRSSDCDAEDPAVEQALLAVESVCGDDPHAPCAAVPEGCMVP